MDHYNVSVMSRKQSADDGSKGQRVHLAHTSTNPAPAVAATGSRAASSVPRRNGSGGGCSAARRSATAARPCRTPGLYFHAHDLTLPPELRGIGVRLEQHMNSTDYMRRISHSPIGSCYKQIA